MPISSERTQQLINIALLLLKSHNPQAIHTFKDFLTFVPSPHHIRKILIIAVSQLVETEPETIYWLLQHPECLQPELNIKKIAAETL